MPKMAQLASKVSPAGWAHLGPFFLATWGIPLRIFMHIQQNSGSCSKIIDFAQNDRKTPKKCVERQKWPSWPQK